ARRRVAPTIGRQRRERTSRDRHQPDPGDIPVGLTVDGVLDEREPRSIWRELDVAGTLEPVMIFWRESRVSGDRDRAVQHEPNRAYPYQNSQFHGGPSWP